MFPLFPENRKSISFLFSGKKKKFQKWRNFILFSYSVMVNFLCFVVLFTAVKTDSKLTLHNKGKIFILYLTEIKLKYGGLHFLKSFTPQRNNGMDFRFSVNEENIECALI